MGSPARSCSTTSGGQALPKMFLVKDGQVLSYERWLDSERSRIYRDIQNILINKG